MKYQAELLGKRRKRIGWAGRPVALLHDPSLVLYLSFDHDHGNVAVDRSGYKNHGVIYGASRVDGKFGRAIYCDGVDDRVVVGLRLDGSGVPFTVYGWGAITIAEWIYPCSPKPRQAWTRFSMIGDYWVDYPCTFLCTNDLNEWTRLNVEFRVRKPDGTQQGYSCIFYNIQNTWLHVVRMFTLDSRELSVWLNGVKMFSTNIPSDYKTILEWNPDNATYPIRYKQFILGADTGIYTFMKCIYDEVRIYSRALTADEIRRIMFMRGV